MKGREKRREGKKGRMKNNRANTENRGNASKGRKPQCAIGTDINNRKLTNPMGAECMEKKQEVGA